MTIFYVEDDENIRNLTIYALEQNGLEVCGFKDSAELYLAMENEQPDLFILDIMLPGEDGITILKNLRNRSSSAEIPIMMLTAKSAEYDIVTGLDNGADDYLAKPFGMMELVSRVNALLRRGQVAAKSDALSVGNVRLSPSKRKVSVGGESVSLTYKEFELLRFLMENINLVFSRDKLLEEIWGWQFGGNSRTVDVHVQTLRQKLGNGSAIIETVRGVGYRVSCQEMESL